MTREPDDRYLWDRSGPVDPEIAALERALRPLRHSAAPRRGRRGWSWLAAAAAVAVAALWGWSRWADEPDFELRLERGARLVEAEVFTATGPTRIELDRYGELQLATGTRLEVQRLAHDRTELFLHEGELEAFVNLDAAPRFFEVGTPAARCVDLGCLYTLTVDGDGVAEVVVSMGQVAFVERGREVLVLAGATCRAWPGRGAGTPRFTDAPASLAQALDAFDAAVGDARPARAGDVMAAAGEAAAEQAALPVWHLMADPDRRVAGAATGHAERRFGRPEGLRGPAGDPPDRDDLEVWRAHLALGW